MSDSTIIYTILFLIFAILLIVTAMKAVQDKNIVHSATWLMFFLFSMAGVFLLLGSSLVASIELLVYVGAIVTLLVFTLMLTGGKEFEYEGLCCSDCIFPCLVRYHAEKHYKLPGSLTEHRGSCIFAFHNIYCRI